MSAWSAILNRVRFFGRGSQFDAEMEDEIRFHIETRAEELEERGVPAKAALEQARREFGSRSLAREDSRGAWQFPWMEDFWRDLGYAARGWKKNPGFTAVAILSLALGVGANCAMFIVVDAMLLRPLAVYRPQEIVSIHDMSVESGVQGLSRLEYNDVRDHSQSFAGLMAFTSLSAGFAAAPGEPARTRAGQLVSWNYFDVLGVKPMLGRTFSRQEDSVAVISYSLWRTVFHSDEHVPGRQVWISGVPFTVIGVTPASFIPFDESLTEDYPDYFVPLEMGQRVGGDEGTLAVTGRLKRGVSLEQGQAELNTVMSLLEKEHPESNRKHTMIVQSVIKYRAAGFGGLAGLIVMLLAAGVLLVACANVAGLQISRAGKRRREIAVRLSLGAGRLRLIRQLLTESFLIALAGGVVGVGLASIPLRIVTRILLYEIPSQESDLTPLRMDGRVLLFSALAALASVILSGLWPAVHATRPDLNAAMNGSDTGPRKRLWGRNLLIAGQVAIALVLLTVTGVIYVWVQKARAAIATSGFDTSHIAAITFDPLVKHFRKDQAKQFYETLTERIHTATGAAAVTLGSAGAPTTIQEDRGNAASRSVFFAATSDNFFDVQGIPILRGRAFRSTDSFGAERVAVVNENLAKAVWPGADPVGKRVRVGGDQGSWVEVVGVAGIRNYDSMVLIPPPQMIFLPVEQSGDWPSLVLYARSRGDQTAVVNTVRKAVHDLDGRQAMPDVHPWGEQLIWLGRGLNVAGIVLLLMGATGIGLSMIGVYGMVAYDVSGRTRELGVRMALGARAGSLLRLTMWRSVALALCGVLAGLAVNSTIDHFLTANPSPPTPVGSNGVTVTWDGATSPLLGLAILSLAALAAWVPARRATGSDCCEALRCE